MTRPIGELAEAAEGLLERQDAGGPQDEGTAERHELDREPPPDEQDDDAEEDRERDGDVAHGRPVGR